MNVDLDTVEPRRSTFPTAIALAIATRVIFGVGGAWLGFALFRLIRPRVADGFWAFGTALLVPLLLVGGSWLAREGWRRRIDLGALRRFERGDVPKAGAWAAVAGIAQPHFEPLEAPLSLRPALACRYRVMDRPYRDISENRHRTSAARKLRLEGYHMVPTVIESSRGRAHLLGFPELRNLEKSQLASGTSGVEDKAVRGPVWPASIVQRGRIFSEPTDRLEIDWQYGKVAEPGRTERFEWVLAPGAEVCAMGRWAHKGGLLPHWSRATGIPLYAGSVSVVTESLRTEARIYLAMGFVLLAAAAGLIAWFV
jgi:hypothetical protein